MRLSQTDFAELQEALLSAFDIQSLREMVRIGLNEDLSSTGGPPLRHVIFDLITWAEREGRTDALISAAKNANPSNPELNRFVARYTKGRHDFPESPIRVLETIIQYVRQEAYYMGEPLPDSKEFTVNRSNLRFVLDQMPLILSTSQETALKPLTVRALVAMILHDAWLARQLSDPDFRFDGDTISGADIAQELRLEIIDTSPHD